MPGVPTTPAVHQEQRQFLQLQQQAAAQITAEQYADALASIDQMLIQQPNDAINRELHNVLKEKLQLDASNSTEHSTEEFDEVTSSESGSEEDAASTASTASQGEANNSDIEDADSDEATVQPVETCDTLHMTRSGQVLSAEQRRQLRSKLAEQLDELKVQQAAQSMNVLGL